MRDLGGHDLSGHDSGGHGLGGGSGADGGHAAALPDDDAAAREGATHEGAARVRAFGVAPEEERTGSAAEETAVPADDLDPLEGDR